MCVFEGPPRMPVTQNMEIRQIRTAQLVALAELLDRNSLWKQLMEVIPKDLQDIDAVDLTRLNAKIIRKYEEQHIR